MRGLVPAAQSSVGGWTSDLFLHRTCFKRNAPELQKQTGMLLKLIYSTDKLIYPQKWT